MSRHNYIDINKLFDFSKQWSYEDVLHDLWSYDLTNIGDEYDATIGITSQIYSDYINKRANYKAYIERGMNLRMLMELRASAILPLPESRMSFYTEHCTLETPDEVKKHRDKIISEYQSYYIGLDWQLYMIYRYFWGGQGKDILIDFEPCYGDGECRMQKDPRYYKLKVLEQHIPKEEMIWVYASND